VNVVRDKPAAKWMPSRHRFAIARLIAYVMLFVARPKAPEADHMILAIDRDQSTVESYTTTIWYLGTLTCFLTAFVPVILAFPLALIVVEIPIYVFGLPFNNRRAVSMGYVACGAAASAYFAMQPTWLRFVAYGYFGMLALDAIAFMAMWLLRNRVRAAEERCVA
jgi:hypothetical protein